MKRGSSRSDTSFTPPLPMQLLRARDAVMQRFRPHLREQGLTDQQGRILRVLAESERLEMSELAARTSIHPASLSRIVPGLMRKGIVRRRKIDEDARRVLVAITERGRAIIAPVIRRSEAIYAELAAELGARRWRELNRSLELLIGAAEDRRAPRDQRAAGAPIPSSRRSAAPRKASIFGHAS